MRWLLVILMAPVLLQGQQTGINECSRRSIPLGVLDREYRFIDDLKPASLRIKAGDHTLTIDRMSLTSPRRMRLLLDVSGSMVQRNKWQVVQMLAHDMVRSAPADVEIALSTFAKDYREMVAYTRDRNAIRGALAELTYESLKARKGAYRTLLVDALVTAARQDTPLAMGDAIYVLTDGDDNLSDSSLRNVRRELLQRGMRVCFFFVRDQTHPAHYIDNSDFRRLAAASGGYVIDLASSRYPTSAAYGSTDFYYELSDDNLRALAAAASVLYKVMFRFYTLEMQVPDSLQSRNSKLKVAVLDERGERVKNVEVTHPQELLRCEGSATATKH